ncbi:SDR family oxidoreductase [Dyadobacter sp. CY356]|uniref:SDR family oxidoreductase n=1 Tax=Dyadobacter sp. CY356 TaxID=2906442 RepID=UPI001F1FDA4D|nr:SDR family oxidoreductase [Dyadobacter sp. CY356]MCF0056686.1 SDR family oxidoreductase [Dyadobacter sp. CY356]
MSKILVTGATGHLGAAVTNFLLQKTDASNISILVRDPAKAEGFKTKGVNIHVGDYDNSEALLKAFDGVDKLYLVSGLAHNRGEQHENVINAAKKAGVKQILYTSFQRKTEASDSPIGFIAESHLYTENVLKASGVIYTILQHGLYADIIPMFAGAHLLQSKAIYLPAGEGKTAFATREDFAETGANILLDETDKFDNQSIELAGSEAISWADIAAMISKVTGETISYVNPPVSEFVETLTKAGAPAEMAGLVAGFSQAIGQGEFEGTNGILENILRRKPATVEEYLKGVYGKA